MRDPVRFIDPFADVLYTQESSDRAIVDAVAAIAKGRGVSRAQVSLAWLRHNPVVVAPLVGASKPSHLDTAVASLESAKCPSGLGHRPAESPIGSLRVIYAKSPIARSSVALDQAPSAYLAQAPFVLQTPAAASAGVDGTVAVDRLSHAQSNQGRATSRPGTEDTHC